MLARACHVEVAGGNENTQAGEPVHGGPAVLTTRGPQVQRALGVVDPVPDVLQGRHHDAATPPVTICLDLDVSVIVQGGNHGSTHRSGDHEPGMLPYCEELADERLITGQEPGPVAGHVGSFRQRVRREQAAVITVANLVVKDRVRLSVPDELPVALIGDQHGTSSASVTDPASQLVCRHHPPTGIRRGIDPDEVDRAIGIRGIGELVGMIRSDDPSPGELGAHSVGRVGRDRHDDRAVRRQPQLGGQPGNELLGADDWQHVLMVQSTHRPPALQVAHDGVPQLCSTPHRGIAVGIRGLGKGMLDELRSGIDRGAH